MGRRPGRRATIVTIAGVGIIAIAIAAIAFAPWRLLIDTEVRDADPFASAATSDASDVAGPGDVPAVVTTTATGSATPAPPTNGSSPTTAAPPIRVGSFRSIAHQTSGDVRVGPTPDGRQVVHLDGLATDNGPDVRVFLSPHPPEGDDSIYGTDELELGPLKGNVGDQTYEVPADVDLARYQSVVLWCERFSVGFGVAGLTPA